MKRKLILASSSPRRREILEKMGLKFEIVKSSYEEVFDDLNFSYEKIEKLAYNKAKSVYDEIVARNLSDSSYIILSADTVVVLDNQIMCKPKNSEEAVSMLKKLSGKKHSVVTSICSIDCSYTKEKLLSTTSYVEFKVLNDILINEYVEKYSPLDKAGSYGIQELPEGFVNKIEGSFENIMGLSPDAVKNILNF